MSYSSEVLADSPVAYWRLGDGSGTTAADSSGNSRPTTWDAAPTYVSGLLVGDSNGAVNPNSHFASLADAAWMHDSALTVEAWVNYTTVVASAGIVDKYGGGGVGQSRFLFYTPSSKFTFLIRDNVGDKSASSSATISTGTTYHVVGTCDGTNVKLYVNGSLISTVACGPLATGTAAMLIGKTGFNSAFTNGVIDEVAIYGTALSATRIAAHYTAGTTSGSAASGTASLSLTASGGTSAAGTGSASLSLSASGGAAAPAAGSASLSLSASGALTPPSPASGSASLTLSAAGGASGSPGGTASLNLTATGTALAVLAASGSATLTLTAAGSAVMSAGGTATLTLTASGIALALYETDTSNAFDGLDILLTARVILGTVVTTPPASVTTAHYDKAIAYPVPTMVGGRPT